MAASYHTELWPSTVVFVGILLLPHVFLGSPWIDQFQY